MIDLLVPPLLAVLGMLLGYFVLGPLLRRRKK